MDTLRAMEQAAVITDIHANLPAVEAVLARIDELGIRRVYCGPRELAEKLVAAA